MSEGPISLISSDSDEEFKGSRKPRKRKTSGVRIISLMAESEGSEATKASDDVIDLTKCEKNGNKKLKMSTSPEKDDEVHVSRWTRYVKPTQMRVDPPSRQQSIHPSGGPSIQSDKGTKSGHDFQIPPSSAGMLLEELSPSSLEYKKLHDRIKTGCPHVEISKIEKVNDPRRRKKYESHRCFLVDSKVLLKSYFGMSRSLTMVYQVDANERQLFHGASSDSITKILRQGFNRNYAGKNGTSFGIGTYFALDPGYSVNYAHPDEQGLQRMLLCDVLVGEAAAGSAGLRAPPPRRAGADPHELCDSTVDNVAAPRILVCYHDDQVPQQASCSLSPPPPPPAPSSGVVARPRAHLTPA